MGFTGSRPEGAGFRKQFPVGFRVWGLGFRV